MVICKGVRFSRGCLGLAPCLFGAKMKRIPLTHGKFALVDDGDYEWLSQYNWHYKTSKGMCKTETMINGKKISMHRLILGLSHGDGILTDHINHNGIDNQRNNIRPCTSRQNQQNRKPYKNKSSKYKGVSWYKQTKKWKPSIKSEHGYRYLGYYKSEIEAARAYDEAAKELFGEFAYLNFP